jgi:hypothetical protein
MASRLLWTIEDEGRPWFGRFRMGNYLVETPLEKVAFPQAITRGGLFKKHGRIGLQCSETELSMHAS